MKWILLFTNILAISFSFFAGSAPLPKSWDKDFTIDLQSSGGMLNRSLNVKFTYDSCKYEEHMGGSQKVKAFLLTSAQRKQILKKLREFKLDQVRQVNALSVTVDKATKSICYKTHENTCVSESAAIAIHSEDLANFSGAYAYLLSFATYQNKTKKGK